jgi:hypothetical protein
MAIGVSRATGIPLLNQLDARGAERLACKGRGGETAASGTKKQRRLGWGEAWVEKQISPLHDSPVKL